MSTHQEAFMKRLLGLFVCLITMCSAAGAVPVTGVLKDSAGKPVGGVNVYSFLVTGTDEDHCTAKLEVSAVTDSSGSYSLGELPRLGKGESRFKVAYLPGKLLGWVNEWANMDQNAGWWGKPKPLGVAPVGNRSGQVVDKAHKPMKGVPIECKGFCARQKVVPLFVPQEILKELHITTSFVTDARGIYTIHDLPTNAAAWMMPEKKGLASQRPTAAEMTLDMVLVPSGRLEGVVKDASGAPLDGIRVSASNGDDYYSADSTSDAKGHFAFDDLAPGKWRIMMFGDGKIIPITPSVDVVAGKTVRVPTVSAFPMAKISGKVVFSDAGKPATGVHLSFSSEMDSPNGWTGDAGGDSGDDGAFSGEAVPGQNHIWAEQTPTGYVVDKDSEGISIPKEGLSNITIRLVPAPVGKGRVVDRAGKPVAGATIAGTEPGVGVATSSADGNFSLTLSDGNQGFSGYGNDAIRLDITTPDGELGVTTNVSRAALLANGATIKLGKPASTRVHVILPSGKPAVGALLSLISYYGQEGNSSSSRDPNNTTDSDGNAKVGDLLPGAKYSIVASLPGYYDPANRSQINPASAPKAIAIKLVPANRVQKGRVVDEKFKPVAGAEVRVEGKGMQMLAQTTTDASGNFVLTGMPAGKIDITASKNDQFGQLTVDMSNRPVLVQIKRQDF